MASGADFRSRITLEGGDKITTDLKKIGAEGEKAFDAVGKAADDSTRSVNAFGKAAEGIARQMAAMRSAAQAAGAELATIGRHTNDFGNALKDVANNLIPRFKEVLGLATVGGVAGFFALFENTAKWGHELEENAKKLGLTPGQFGLIAKAAKDAGLDVDQLTTGMLRFGATMEKVGEERQKTFGEIGKLVLGAETAIDQLTGKGATVFRGGTSTGDLQKQLQDLKNTDSITKLQKQIQELNAVAFVTPAQQRQLEELRLQLELLQRSTSSREARIINIPKAADLGDFKEQAEEAYTALRALNRIPKEVTLEKFLADTAKILGSNTEAAAKLRAEFNKIGASLPVAKLGEQIDQTLPGFKDLFAQLKVPLFDKATGGLRKLTDVFGDFLDAFKDKSPTEQFKIIRETMGRGAEELIPIMQKGRKGLLEFFDAAKASGLDTSPFDKDINALDEAYKATRRLDGAINAVRKAFVVPFADVFTPILTTMTESLKSSQPEIKAWATGVANDMKAAALDIQRVWQGAEPQTDFGRGFKQALDAITLAIGLVSQAFAGLTLAMEPVAQVLNAIFGTDYTAKTYALAAALLYFSGILPALVVGLKAVGAALAFMTTNPIGLALTMLGLIALYIYQNWDKLGPLFNSVKQTLVDFGSWVSTTFLEIWNTVFNTLYGLWNSFTNFVGNQVQKLIGWINSLRNLLPGGAAGAASPTGMASGGQVPGTGTGDSFPAMLTPGEFVMRKAAVEALGAPFFAALNRGMGSFLPRTKFATGGIVTGGASAPVHLHLGGQEFALSGQSQVVSALVTEAHRQRMRSGGLKPSWYGGRVSG